MPSTDPTTPLPAAFDMERGVLSCMLQAPDYAIGRATLLLKAEDFHQSAHRLLFAIILEMAETEIPVDLVALQRILLDRQQMESVGGAATVAEIYTFAPTPVHVDHYAKVVRDKAAARRITLAAFTLIERITEDPESWRDHATAMVDRCIGETSNSTKRATIVPIKEAIFAAVDELEEAFKNKGHVTHGLSTGFTDLDRSLMGVRRGDNVVIAGATSMGKTAFALGVLENLALAQGHYREFYNDPSAWPACENPRQKPIMAVYVLLESGPVAVANRLICGRSRISVQRIRDGFMKDHDFQGMTRAAGQLAASPIHVWSDAGITVEELEMELKAFKQKHPELGAVFVDHCGLLETKAIKPGEATAKATFISTRLRNLWKTLDVVGFPMWQLSREVEKRSDKRPKKSDLRDSGNIENDATHILMLYRPAYYHPDDSAEDEAFLVVAKNREGPINLEGLPLKWEGQFTRYSSARDRLFSNNPDNQQSH